MGNITIQQALDDYINIYMPYRNFAERTRVEYQNDLAAFLEHLRGIFIEHVDQLSLAVIERYIARLEEKGFADLTRKRKAITIRSFVSFLFQDGYIQEDIAKKVMLPLVGPGTLRVLTRIESKRLEQVSRDQPRDLAMIELILHTGIRLSELVALTVGDIELGDSESWVYIPASRVHPGRNVPLEGRICPLLRRYLQWREGRNATAALFLNRFGFPLSQRGIQKILRKYLERAAIIGASIHSLRHTFAVRKIEERCPMERVQLLLGNRDKRSVLVYAPYLGKSREAAKY